MPKPSRAAKKEQDHQRWAAVVLAAGKGTRMQSRLPKVIHQVCGRPLLAHVLSSVRGAGVDRIVVVVPPESQDIRQNINGNTEFAEQGEPHGTGHATLAAMTALNGNGANGKLRPEHILVLAGDAPLLQPQTVRALMERHLAANADVTVLTAVGLPIMGLGRIVRDGKGSVVAIVEERDASGGQFYINEINGGIYCFRASVLWPRLLEVMPSASGELYLTDVVHLTARSSGHVEGMVAEDPWDVYGVNTRQQLAQANTVMRKRLCDYWMAQGVTIMDPATTYLDATVSFGEDTIVHPNTHVRGATRVGRDCELGPGAVIADTAIGDGCHVGGSVLEGATLEDGVEVGPYCHLRPGSILKRGVHLGNYVEVKNSTLEPGVRAGHFSYLGDATIGKDVSIGAGTITCNFDGVNKNRTVIGDEAFIGCDTMLVAPIRVGARSITGAGSVVTRDVPDDTLVVGAPARAIRLITPQPPSTTH